MIIGITGTLGAGKGAVVEILKEKGFKHFSVRDFLNNELTKRSLELNRDNQVMLANELRKQNSPSYIIEQLFEKAGQENENCIIESIRNPSEAEKIKQKGGILIAVDALPEIRYSRILARQSETDNVDFEEFLEQEKKEIFSINPYEQNLSECINMADYKIENSKDLGYLEKQIEIILGNIKQKETFLKEILISEPKKEKDIRPSWDEYFMNIVNSVAERATCDRGKTAAIAVKDKRIIATGYVGSPPGLPHCDEVGHMMHKVINEDGSISEHCIRTLHAEQNVICQAARFGISLDGATVYMKMSPCFTCAKMLISAGIKRVVAGKRYQRDVYSIKTLKDAGIQVDILNEEVETYGNQ